MGPSSTFNKQEQHCNGSLSNIQSMYYVCVYSMNTLIPKPNFVGRKNIMKKSKTYENAAQRNFYQRFAPPYFFKNLETPHVVLITLGKMDLHNYFYT